MASIKAKNKDGDWVLITPRIGVQPYNDAPIKEDIQKLKDEKANREELVGKKTLEGGEVFNNTKNEAPAKDATAMGNNTHAKGEGSFTSGEGTTAKGYASSAMGENTIAENEAEHAVGVWNKSTKGASADQQTIDSIGIGTGVTHANAQETMRNGDLYIKNIGGYDGTNPDNSKTIQEIVNNTVPEAPIDGNYYTRKDGKWEQRKLTGYEDIYSYGVEWDITVSDPHLTRIGNPLLHKSLPVQSQYKGCVAKGKEIQYYLNPRTWEFKEDGVTASVLDGTEGTVKVHTPKFYGKSGINKYDKNKRWVRISLIRIDDTWVEIPEMLIDAYRCTVNQTGNKAESVVNTTPLYRGGGNRVDNDTFLSTDAFKTDLGKPRTAISRATMRGYAKNAGSELMCYDFYKWIFYWAYVIEYANFNAQESYKPELTAEGYHQGGLGPGCTTIANWGGYNGYYPLTPCGYCNEFGNFTGVKEMKLPEYTYMDKEQEKVQAPQTLQVARWRGFDNPFGDIWTNLDGIVLKREAANEDSKVYTTSDPSKFDDSLDNKIVAGIEVAKDGYIKAFDLGSTGEIIPSEVEGGSTTYMSDYHYCNVEYTELRPLWVGGRANHYGNAGLGYFRSYNSVTTADTTAGFRTLIRL